VLEPRYRWVLPALPPSDPADGSGRPLAPDRFDREGDDDGWDGQGDVRPSPRLRAILAARGIVDDADVRSFFGPPLAALHDPERLPDAARFRARIARARAGGERILVFGDFDADGLTGLAIMTIALRSLGLDAEPYVPSRLEEGHGLSLRAVETAVAAGRSVVVTVDCGTTSHAEIAAASQRGIDVLVTDHHHVPDVPPAAHALVNPQRPDSTYPERRLAGSGVAFKVAQLLLASEPGGPERALALAELAVIGAVSDVVPIVGENRGIARLGLERLRRSPRPGLAALLDRARIAPSRVDLETVAFQIAPRLNAAGRVGEAVEAARLLLTEDAAEAAALADVLEAANDARRVATRTALAEARLAIVDDAVRATGSGEAASALVAAAPAVVVRGPWPVGIVGLVAARLAEETGRPAVVGAELDGIVRASCRNPGPLDLAGALTACSDLLIRHGGHRGAAGFEIDAVAWDRFRERFLAIASIDAPPEPDDPRPLLRVDVALPAQDVDYALLRELDLLAPTGPGNPDPLVAAFGMTVARVRAANGGHTQLTLRRGRDVVDAIAFGRDDLPASVAEGDVVDVVARLASRSFAGLESLQLEVRDIASAGARAIARAEPAMGGAEPATESAEPAMGSAEPAMGGAEPATGAGVPA
jgi:single-stranded-DNA-specific exonuclease